MWIENISSETETIVCRITHFVHTFPLCFREVYQERVTGSKMNSWLPHTARCSPSTESASWDSDSDRPWNATVIFLSLRLPFLSWSHQSAYFPGQLRSFYKTLHQRSTEDMNPLKQLWGIHVLKKVKDLIHEEFHAWYLTVLFFLTNGHKQLSYMKSPKISSHFRWWITYALDLRNHRQYL